MDSLSRPAMLKVETDVSDVFVMVLLPQLPAFKVEKPLELDICGRGMLEWVQSAVAKFEHKEIEVSKTDDILSIVSKNVDTHKFTAVVYADTPLLTTNTLEQAISYAATYGHRACRMPRGWIFETSYIKTQEQFETTDVPNLPVEDFVVAYNYGQLAAVNALQRQRIIGKHFSNGVQIVDPTTTYIDADVEIAKGVKIEPNVHLKGSTVIKKGALLMSGCRIENSTIGESVTVNHSQIVESEVGEGTVIGPYANLRPKSKIGKNCRLTNFVEIKNSTIGNKTKVAHMTYVGDAVLGESCNIGCGVVFCSYNGKVKQQCTLGDKVFVGSNSNLVAPLKLEKNAYIAAGSTITQDVPKNALGIARARQAIKEDWNISEEE